MEDLRGLHWGASLKRGVLSNLLQLYILTTLLKTTEVHGLLECKFLPVAFDPQEEVQRYGSPTPYITTRSIGFSPYQLVDPYRQSALFHEYLLIGPGYAGVPTELLKEDDVDRELELGSEEIHLILYEADSILLWEFVPNLVHQNLGKEFYWTMINATGVLPSMTIINTTFETTFRFHTDEDNTVSYHAIYPRTFRSRETVPPLDVVIEFPAKTRLLRTLKTLIDYQTFGLLRWRLTPEPPVPWLKLTAELEFTRFLNFDCDRNLKDWQNDTVGQLLCNNLKRFHRLENPCIKDMFVLYVFRGKKANRNSSNEDYTSVNKLFIVIPMVYDVLNYEGWYDLTEAYCSRPKDNEECGNPLDIKLTNDHLLILTNKGLWVSGSLNESNANVSLPYSMKPLLKFTPVDPCAEYTHFNCSELGTPILVQQTFRRQRLFYNPVCHLYQYPNYEDFIMLVIDHVSQTPDYSEEQDVFTVMFSATPYREWKTLFHAQSNYISRDKVYKIKDLVGIFFNHHRRHFDISLVLNDWEGVEKTVRFILPLNLKEDPGYKELSWLHGDGFLEYEFPQTFHLMKVVVNPEPMDVFFLGNQLYISEAAGPFVYLSVPIVFNQLGEPGFISDCSFNHPDRSYVCMEDTHYEILTGRVGVSYSPIVVKYEDIPEFDNIMKVNFWPEDYRRRIASRAQFIAGYSGKIMVWFLFDYQKVLDSQKVAVEKFGVNKGDCTKLNDPTQCEVCEKLITLSTDYSCNLIGYTHESDPRFRMLALDPANFKARSNLPSGPLVPYIIDGDKGNNGEYAPSLLFTKCPCFNIAIVFEAVVPDLDKFKPSRNYLNNINIGNKIFCETPIERKEADECAQISTERVKHTCELYIRHLKHFKSKDGGEILHGFRASFFATIINAFTLMPIPTDLVIIVWPDSNKATIQLDTSMYCPKGVCSNANKPFRFRYGHIGQTLFLPSHFSVLLAGFPNHTSSSKDEHDMTRIVGLATRYYRKGIRIEVRAYDAFIIDFGSKEYCEFHKLGMGLKVDGVNGVEMKDGEYVELEYAKIRDEKQGERNGSHEGHTNVSKAINNIWNYKGRPIDAIAFSADMLEKLSDLEPNTYHELEDELLKVTTPTVVGDSTQLQLPLEEIKPNETDKDNFECAEDHWGVNDGGCHFRLNLVTNPVIKQNGGRISLDKHDSITFTVHLRSLTPLGKSLIFRPLIGISNTNSKILTVESKDSYGRDPQVMQITLTPTGLNMGVASVTVRPLIVSTKCPFADGGFTLIVQVHRAEGRRLHVNYPIPICKPIVHEDDFNERPWKIDLPSCVTEEELLNNEVIRRPDKESGQIFYKTLPKNYRPPSLRGKNIPLSENVYHVDPAAAPYKNKYQISKETSILSQCFGRASRKDCDCNEISELSDDVKYTDCKRRVYTVKRGHAVDISVEYDRVMKDQDQLPEFFSPKVNWSVYVEEVNERNEFTLNSQTSLYLETVNNDSQLHGGRTYYDAKTLRVTLHGTGLYHFKVGLGDFESFEEVTGYFMLFADDNELNQIQIVIIMLLTITVCMVFVFCGFLIVRNRLSSQLPFQTQVKNKIKLE